MNPLVYLFAALALFLAGATGGWKACADHRDALNLAEFKGRADALDATAREIAKLDIKQVTIKQTAETIIKERTVYQECKNTPEMMKVLNEAAKGGAK